MEKTFYVISFCDDIPDSLMDELEEYPCGVYVPYKILSEEEKYSGEYSLRELDIFLYHKFKDQRGKEILINMDY